MEFFGIDLEHFADIAYTFMTGLQGRGLHSMGFTMMGPEELMRMRWTYVKYWLRRIREDRKAVAKQK